MRLIALVVAVLFAAQDPKVEFKFNPKKGDKLKLSGKMEFQMKLSIDAGGQMQEMDIEHRSFNTRTTEYAEVVDGQLAKVIVDVTELYDEDKRPPAMEWQRTDKPLHGRKLTIFQKDGILFHEGSEGLKEADVKSLNLKNPFAQVYPAKPVAVGEEWEIKGEAVREFLGSDEGDLKEAKIKFKLKEVKDIDKKRCAILTGKLEAKGTAEGDMTFTANLDLDLVVWLERGYLLSAKGKGKVNIKGDNDQMTITGEGPMTMDMTTKVE